MHRQVLSILRRHAVRMLLTRCAQRAVRAGACGAAVAAVLTFAAAWAFRYPMIAGVIAALPALALAAMLPWRRLREPLLARTGPGAAALAVIFITCVYLYSRPDALLLLPRWAPLLLPLITAAVAAAARAAAGVTVAQAAACLDRKAGLRERLVTAAELAGREDVTPTAQAVYAQALEALAALTPQQQSAREDAGAWHAAAALVLVLAVLLTLVPVVGLSQEDARVSQLVEAVPTMSAQQRAQLTEAFRQAALAAAKDANVAAELARAAAVVEVQDAQELQKVLAKLRAMGYQPLDSLPASVLAAAGIRPKGAAPVATPPPIAGDANRSIAARGGEGAVRVYDPAYAAMVKAAASSPAMTAPAMTTFEDAWSAARARAASAARRGDIPPQYQQLIRDYFGSSVGVTERSP